MVSCTQDDVLGYNEGDVVTIQGKKYFLEKKSSRTIRVRRYYWFDAVISKIVQLLGGA